jgi:hypothetical protein
MTKRALAYFLLFVFGATSAACAMQKKTEMCFFKNKTIKENKRVVLKEDTVFDGKGKILVLKGKICVKNNATFTLKNITVVYEKGSSVEVEDGSFLVLEGDVKWVVRDKFIFSQGSFVVKNGTFHVCGRAKDGVAFSYFSSKKSIVKNNAKLKFSNVAVTYEPMNGCENRFVLEGGEALLWMNNSELFHQTNFFLGDAVKIKISGRVIFQGMGYRLKAGECLIFSDQTEKSDFSIFTIMDCGDLRIDMPSGKLTYGKVNLLKTRPTVFN